MYLPVAPASLTLASNARIVPRNRRFFVVASSSNVVIEVACLRPVNERKNTMGSLGLPELIIIAVLLGAPVMVIILVVWLVRRKSANTPPSHQHAAPYSQPKPWPEQSAITDQISSLAELRDKGLLTEE